jgi:uncharacterized protein
LRKSLKLLGELQRIDLKVDGLQDEKGAMLAEIAALEAKVAEAQGAISVKNEELGALEAERTGLEENLAAESENITRSESRLKEIQTQKEYQAVSKEISTAKKLTAELEELILQKIAQAEELKGEIVVQVENLQALEQNVAAQKGEVQERIDTLESGMVTDTASREEIVKGLPASVVRRYTMLREQRRGVAVVEAKDGSCLGCNMNLPPQLYNMLFRGDELITCPHCQRMLVLAQETANG